MSEIKDVKVWKAPKYAKLETRIYVHTTDNREGCRYLTGNPWHAAKTTDGNLTTEEWKQAREIAYYDGAWHTTYRNQTPTAQHLDEEDAANQEWAHFMATRVQAGL